MKNCDEKKSSRMTIVLDACAVLAYLNDEQGADAVETYILDPKRRCVIHAVNASRCIT
jgi:PIN domain nuclease of toxin-antitoxin system